MTDLNVLRTALAKAISKKENLDEISDERVVISGIAATGAKDSLDRKTRPFASMFITEDIDALLSVNEKLFRKAVRQTLTDDRNDARRQLEGKGLSKTKAKWIFDYVDENLLNLEDVLEYENVTEEDFEKALMK